MGTRMSGHRTVENIVYCKELLLLQSQQRKLI